MTDLKKCPCCGHSTKHQGEVFNERHKRFEKIMCEVDGCVCIGNAGSPHSKKYTCPECKIDLLVDEEYMLDTYGAAYVYMPKKDWTWYCDKCGSAGTLEEIKREKEIEKETCLHDVPVTQFCKRCYEEEMSAHNL